MSLRPQPARWFEMLTVREETARALETLARTGAVELEVHPAGEVLSAQEELGVLVEEFKELARRYTPYWPHGALHPSPRRIPLPTALAGAMQQLHAWQRDADPLIERLEAGRREQAELALWQDMFANLEHSTLDFTLLAAAGPVLAVRFFILPADAPPLALPPGTLATSFDMAQQQVLLAACADETVAEVMNLAAKSKARCLAPGAWRHAAAKDNLAEIETRQSALAKEVARLESALDALTPKYNLLRALGDINRLAWLTEAAPALQATENFALVTGWTDDFTGEALAAALHHRRVHALVHFPQPPPDAQPPQLLRNPRWVRPFELFVRILGTPAGYEVDPSLLLVVIAPLLFGYMFGDVGQGLLLAGFGWYFRNRLPAARLVVAGGLAAALFGLLFGSIFSRDDLIPALWLHPMDAPSVVLGLPIIGGAALLLIGLGLDAAEARWRRPGTWPAEAGLPFLYIGTGAVFFHPLAAVVALGGAIWFLAGRTRLQPGWRGLARSIGELLEHVLQLAMGTLSFARVGAFALAHAGLSQAIGIIAAASPGWVSGLLIQIVGNLLLVTLEALVVSVQTARLVLFEFFIRFLRAEGRPFRPLAAPRLSL